MFYNYVIITEAHIVSYTLHWYVGVADFTNGIEYTFALQYTFAW